MKFDVKQNVTAPLKFNLDMNINDGLALGQLTEVELVVNDASESTAEWEYKGLELPTLLFRFTQKKNKEDDPERKFTHVERVIVSIGNTGDKLPKKTLDSLYTSMWRRLKHIYDAYANFAPNVKAMEQEEVNAVMIDEDASAEERAKQFTAFFKYFENLFNKGTDDKPIYKDTNGKPYLMTLKLVAEYGGGEYYTFPTFTGEGFIEKAVFDANKQLVTNLRLRSDETIEFGKSRKATPGNTDSNVAAGVNAMPDDVKKRLGLA